MPSNQPMWFGQGPCPSGYECAPQPTSPLTFQGQPLQHQPRVGGPPTSGGLANAPSCANPAACSRGHPLSAGAPRQMPQAAAQQQQLQQRAPHAAQQQQQQQAINMPPMFAQSSNIGAMHQPRPGAPHQDAGLAHGMRAPNVEHHRMGIPAFPQQQQQQQQQQNKPQAFGARKSAENPNQAAAAMNRTTPPANRATPPRSNIPSGGIGAQGLSNTGRMTPPPRMDANRTTPPRSEALGRLTPPPQRSADAANNKPEDVLRHPFSKLNQQRQQQQQQRGGANASIRERPPHPSAAAPPPPAAIDNSNLNSTRTGEKTQINHPYSGLASHRPNASPTAALPMWFGTGKAPAEYEQAPHVKHVPFSSSQHPVERVAPAPSPFPERSAAPMSAIHGGAPFVPPPPRTGIDLQQQRALSPQLQQGQQQRPMSPQQMGQQRPMSPQNMGQQRPMSPQQMGQQHPMSPHGIPQPMSPHAMPPMPAMGAPGQQQQLPQQQQPPMSPHGLPQPMSPQHGIPQPNAAPRPHPQGRHPQQPHRQMIPHAMGAHPGAGRGGMDAKMLRDMGKFQQRNPQYQNYMPKHDAHLQRVSPKRETSMATMMA